MSERLNCKIKVVKTEASWCLTEGKVYEVIDGTFKDDVGFVWVNDGNYFYNFSEIQRYLAEDPFQTEFELIEEVK